MHLPLRGRRMSVFAVLAIVAVSVMALLPSATQYSVARRLAAFSPPSAATLTIGSATIGQPVAAGFLGLSTEYWALENYAGTNPRAVDPVLVHLIRNLTRGQPAVIRIGGVTTDRVWWPVAGVRRPPGAAYILTRRRLEVAKALARATGARLLLGVQFEADSSVEAAAQSRAMTRVIGRRWIEGFELGNEPEQYANASFYTAHGVAYFGRPHSWNFESFIPDYTRIAAAMGRVPLVGPTIGALGWVPNLDQFLNAEPGLSLVTLHRYPLQGCTAPPGAPNYPSIANLLSDAASVGLADNFASYVADIHAHGFKVRNGEMNSVACGNAHGVANTFASALWSLSALFEMARIGVDGVNMHTFSGADDQLFKTEQVHSGWRAFVAPLYYGLLMFSQAAPAGSRLLQVSGASSTPRLRTYATRARDGRIRVVMINDDTRAKTVTVRVNGRVGVGRLERLQAAGLRSTRDVTIGGQTFGSHTTTGRLPGPLHTFKLASTAGAYLVHLPAASGALLTLR